MSSQFVASTMNASVIESTDQARLLNRSFQEQTTSVFVNAMSIFLSVIGILGNSLVLVVLIRVEELRTITNLLIFNQSLLDLAAAIFLLLRFIPMIAAYFDTPIQGILVCTFLKDEKLLWTAMTGSTYNLVLITLERYYAVVHPIRYKTLATFKRAVLTACAPWLIGLLIMSPEYITLRVEAGGDCVSNFTLTGHIIYGIAVAMSAYLFPLGCMSVAYIRILMSLKTKVGNRPVPIIGGSAQTVAELQGINTSRCVDITSNSEDGKHVPNVSNDISPRDNTNVASSSTEPRDEPTNKNKVNTLRVRRIGTRQVEGARAKPAYRDRAKKNIISTLLIVSLTYVVCWTPSTILFFLHSLRSELDYQSHLFYIAEMLACCNICVNPFIYTFKYRRFRKGLKKLFRMEI